MKNINKAKSSNYEKISSGFSAISKEIKGNVRSLFKGVGLAALLSTAVSVDFSDKGTIFSQKKTEISSKVGNVDDTAPVLSSLATTTDVTPLEGSTTVAIQGSSFVMPSYDKVHSITVTDENGKETTATFEMDDILPLVSGVVNGEVACRDVTPGFYLSEGSIATLNGEPFDPYTTITKSGKYTLELKRGDDVSMLYFEIDKTAPVKLTNTNYSSGFSIGQTVSKEIDFSEKISKVFSAGGWVDAEIGVLFDVVNSRGEMSARISAIYDNRLIIDLTVNSSGHHPALPFLGHAFASSTFKVSDAAGNELTIPVDIEGVSP
ncbi:hypothetical protein COB57_04195 [Candidatus Peregrinibacteria bacterium]|nr:MAG: hypothetical protein COB57_04195 [Candidatus Peregrinibacteria bacterium]